MFALHECAGGANLSKPKSVLDSEAEKNFSIPVAMDDRMKDIASHSPQEDVDQSDGESTYEGSYNSLLLSTKTKAYNRH